MQIKSNSGGKFVSLSVGKAGTAWGPRQVGAPRGQANLFIIYKIIGGTLVEESSRITPETTSLNFNMNQG